MVLPVLNFAALPPSNINPWGSMLEGLQRGFGLGADLSALKKRNQAQDLANQLSKIDLQYAPKMNEAKLNQLQSLANLPFGGTTLPGSAGQVLALESIRQMFGEDSPQYKMALNDFSLQQESDKARINYQNVLAQTAPARSLTPTGKSIIEQANVSQGFSPTGASKLPNMPVPEVLRNMYERKQLKETTDEKTRARNLFATNIEKTLAQIDPTLFAKYSGVRGHGHELIESGLSTFGLESPNFDKYKQSAKAAELLASQIRQFYGESIQPSLRDELKTLTNPTSWKNSPKQTLTLFNKTKNILEQEMQTLRDALKGTSVYYGAKNPDSQSLELNPTPDQIKSLIQSGQAQPGNSNIRKIGNQNYVNINGKWYLQ